MGDSRTRREILKTSFFIKKESFLKDFNIYCFKKPSDKYRKEERIMGKYVLLIIILYFMSISDCAEECNNRCVLSLVESIRNQF